jgi:hypothetical protein
MYYQTVVTAEHVCHHVFVKHGRIYEMPETTVPWEGGLSAAEHLNVYALLSGVEFL